MSELTPVSSAVGGALIGLSATLLLLLNGRIAGVVGIFGGALVPRREDFAWRLLFVAGLVTGGAVLVALRPGTVTAIATQPLWVAIAAGLLVGFGSRLGGGCTSGHGVCGISRLSMRSLVATVVFMAAGAATVYVVRHVIGGGT